jgi:hypothetical protein
MVENILIVPKSSLMKMKSRAMSIRFLVSRELESVSSESPCESVRLMSQRDVVWKYLRHRDAVRQLTSTHSRRGEPEKNSIDRFVAVSMGTHTRLGERCQLRDIDLPGAGLVRSIAEWAMVLCVPGDVELKKALDCAIDFGWPIQLSPGTYNLGNILCPAMPSGRPLSIAGVSGQETPIILCTWILSNSSCIFEDLILRHSYSPWFDSRCVPAPCESKQ